MGHSMGSGHGHAVTISSHRETQHGGRHIEVKTTYEVTVDGKPFGGHLVLGDDGTVYSHACPYDEFKSMIDLMKHLVSAYPDAFRSGIEQLKTSEIPPQS